MNMRAHQFDPRSFVPLALTGHGRRQSSNELPDLFYPLSKSRNGTLQPIINETENKSKQGTPTAYLPGHPSKRFI